MSDVGKKALSVLLMSTVGSTPDTDMEEVAEKVWPYFKDAVKQAAIEVEGELRRKLDEAAEAQKAFSRRLEELDKPKN